MAELQQDRIGGDEPPHRRSTDEPVESYGHVAVGYTDRARLDDFIDGEGGDLVVRGPIHTGQDVRSVSTLGPGVTEGTPCLVVPLVAERIDEIRREVGSVLDRFAMQGEAPGADNDHETEAGERRPRTIEGTGGTTRGASSGAIRTGSTETRGH